MTRKLKIRDLTLRDGQQSLFATRLPQAEIDKLLPYYENAGFYIMEVWGGAVLQYFLALEQGINLFPGFAPELQGVYIEEDEDGRQVAWANVLTHERETELLGKAL